MKRSLLSRIRTGCMTVSIVSCGAGCGAPSNPQSILILKAHSGSLEARLCIKQVRLLRTANSTGAYAPLASFTPKRITLTATDQTIGTFGIPYGVYERAELVLEKNCTGSAAPAMNGLTTGGITFTSDVSITLGFNKDSSSSSFTPTVNGQVLKIDFSAFSTQLDTLTTDPTTDGDLRDSLSTINGAF